MKKALLLYFLVFAALGLANWQPTLNWLTPLALLVLLGGVLLLWRSEGRTFRDLGIRKTKFWLSDLGKGLVIGLVLPEEELSDGPPASKSEDESTAMLNGKGKARSSRTKKKEGALASNAAETFGKEK